MKFRLAKGFNVAEVAAGQHLYRLDEAQPELSTWEPDAIATMLGRPGIDVVEEKVGDVVAQVPDATDRELKAIFAYDRRDGVQKAVQEELDRRREERQAQLAAELEARNAELAAPVLAEHKSILEGDQ